MRHWVINQANLLGILVSLWGFLAFASWPIVSIEVPWRPAAESPFLEEWWKAGQGKGFRWWGTEINPPSPEAITLHALIAGRADLRQWSQDEIRDLSSFILDKSREYKLSPLLVLSLIDVESRYQPAAISRKGAIGMLQLLPDTGAEMAAASGVTWTGPALLRDPKTNIDLGLRYVVQLRREFRDPARALTAYNIGPQAMRDKLESGEPYSLRYFDSVMTRLNEYHKKARLPRAQSRQWAQTWL